MAAANEFVMPIHGRLSLSLPPIFRNCLLRGDASLCYFVLLLYLITNLEEKLFNIQEVFDCWEGFILFYFRHW